MHDVGPRKSSDSLSSSKAHEREDLLFDARVPEVDEIPRPIVLSSLIVLNLLVLVRVNGTVVGREVVPSEVVPRPVKESECSVSPVAA